MNRVNNGKAKWLVVFTICLACCLLCASMITAPTAAAPSPVRDAYYNWLTANTGAGKTYPDIATLNNTTYPFPATVKPGIGTVLFMDLDKCGTEEMVVVSIVPTAEPTRVFDLRLDFYNYKSSTVTAVKQVSAGTYGSPAAGNITQESAYVFLKEASNGRRYVGVEWRITDAGAATPGTDYRVKLSEYTASGAFVDAVTAGALKT